jgi:signal transduction histidine kinase
MASTDLRTGWGALVQALVDSEGQGVRARILLECLAREPWVDACGLWRREAVGGAWTCILLRGAHELLPGQGFVEEVAAGRTPADLLPGRGVLLSGGSAGSLALTYAGRAAAEPELDLVAGLLHVVRLVDAAEAQSGGGSVEAFVPALPRPSDERDECQPAALLESLRAAESAHCARSRIDFRLELEPGVEGCTVRLAGPEFVRAVLNLVSNARDALEHTQQGGRIRVTLQRALDSRLVLAVEDTGPGLPAEVREALAGAGPECLGGPGLGLAVSWGIALSAGGTLHVADSGASGTSICLELPLSGPSRRLS